MLVIGTYLTKNDWLAVLWFGLLGILPDVIDTIASFFGKRFMHYEPFFEEMMGFWKTVLCENIASYC